MKYEDYPVMINQSVISKMLSTENYEPLLALYIYYYYKARKQKDNSIDCPDIISAKELKWSRPKIIKYRKILEDMDLISYKQVYNASGMLIKRFVTVNFIFKKDSSVNQVFNDHIYNERDVSINTNKIVSNGVINESKLASCEIKQFEDENRPDDLFSGIESIDTPSRSYSKTEMNIGVAANLISKDMLDWEMNLKLKITTGSKFDYKVVLEWWFEGFSLYDKKRLGNEYGNIRFDYIKDKYLKWALNPNTRKLATPYSTLLVFYSKQMTAADYVESRSLNVSEVKQEILSGTFEWKKDIVFSLRGSKDDYEHVMEWWFTNMPTDFQDEIYRIYDVSDISPVAYQLFLEMKAEPRRSSSFYERLIRKLNYMRNKK